MKKNLATKVSNVCDKAKVAMTGATVLYGLAMTNIAFAADGGQLLEKILELLAKILIPFGVILGIMGVVHFASAKSEGDGPASNKAVGQMAAGVMLVVLSLVLMNMAGEFAGMLAG